MLILFRAGVSWNSEQITTHMKDQMLSCFSAYVLILVYGLVTERSSTWRSLRLLAISANPMQTKLQVTVRRAC
ncbi:hypothetical protein BDV98DRAFT_205815 [Pterulicium gracile]|uniref:Uncharacterized protein n=1 Tax=Pterulicium gracile TaxID=1884261 RepID=A0A5C3QAB4_9AGAR|nr:hypothetical protein BDV98DRAFT_205815 [Pterula gracilis]